MGSWEDELDVDLSDIWAAGSSKPVQEGTQQQQQQVQAEEEKDDDLAFPTQPPEPAKQAEIRVSALEVENRGLGLGTENAVTRLQSGNGATPLLNVDVADAPTQIASLSAEPFVSRGGTTEPLATERLPSKRLPPLPSFQPVILGEGSSVPHLPTQNLAFRGNEFKQQRVPEIPGSHDFNPNPREKAPQQQSVDIRKYFTHTGSSSGSGEGAARKKPRIPGPVGDLFRKDQRDKGDVVDCDGNGFRCAEDDFNERVFRTGAWISALQSLNVDEFDPARYAVLKVTASSIGSSRAQRIPHFVAVIKELTPNVFGDAAVLLKDPTGTVAGMMNHKVFSNTDYARAISPGAAIVLKQVAIFSPSAHHLNITISNVVQVFPANTDLPQASAPKEQQQRQQEAVPQQQEQPHKPRSQPRSQTQSRPRPPASPPQPEQDQPAERQSQPPSEPLPQREGQQQQRAPEPRSQPRPPPSPPQEPEEGPQGGAHEGPPEGPKAAPPQKRSSWDLLSPSPSPPREPQEPQAGPEGIATAAKMAGWGDLTDDMEALLNEDVDNFYA